jgi:hypothetical protein
MGHAKQLPYRLAEAPFSTRRARADGVAAGRLRARDVEHPFHGVNAITVNTTTVNTTTVNTTTVNTTSAPSTLIDRCAAYAERMLDGQAFSHATAAALHGLPLSGKALLGPLHVSVAYPRTPPRTRDVVGHSLAKLDIREVAGMCVCSALQVWLQLGATVGREELVAIGDHIVGSGGRHPFATVDEVREAARAHKAKGALALRWAADRVRWGADSRPESLLRLAVVEAGFPEPSVNPPIMLPDGRTIHPDLVFFAHRTILEYEGDGHRTDAGQWMRDIRPHDESMAADWRVMRVTRADLFVDRPEFLRRLGRTLRTKGAGGRRRAAPSARVDAWAVP